MQPNASLNFRFLARALPLPRYWKSSLSNFLLLVLITSTSSVAWPAQPGDPANGTEFFVSTSGNDASPGTAANPFATIARAQQAVRQSRASQPIRAVTVWLAGGTYPQIATLTFTSGDGGQAGAPVIYRSMPGQTAIISGGRRLTGTWQMVPGKPYLSLSVPEAKDRKWWFNSIYIDGISWQIARKANASQPFMTGTGPVPGEPANGAFYFNPGDLDANWPDIQDGYLVMIGSWTATLHSIISINNDTHVIKFVSSTLRPVNAFYKKFPYYLCNVIEALDEPGEWYLDRTTGTLYAVPLPNQDLNSAVVVAPVVKTMLLNIQGTADNPVAYLEFHDLAFEHTDANLEKCDGIYRQGSLFLGAGVVANYLNHSVFENCEIAHSGEYGLELSVGCQDNLVTHCHIWDTGGGAIQLGIIDLTTQSKLEQELPASRVRTLRNTIDNCLIHRDGTIWPNVYAIAHRFASFSEITHNEIFDTPWCAIGTDARWNPYHEGDDFCHGNEVAYNNLHDLGLGFLRDTGGYYQFGPGDTHIHHNLVHDTRTKNETTGFCGIYLDEQSRHCIVENNLVYRVEGDAYHLHWGFDNVFKNNIGAFARDGFFASSRDESSLVNTFSFLRNIYLSNSTNILIHPWKNQTPANLDNNLYWNLKGDENLVFFRKYSFAAYQGLGFDPHSLVENPGFTDPEHGDFSFLPSSNAAQEIGFVPFTDEIKKAGLYGDKTWCALGKTMSSRPRAQWISLRSP